MKYLILLTAFSFLFQCSSKEEKEYKASFLEGCAQSVYGATDDPQLIAEYCECAYKEYKQIFPKIVDLDQSNITAEQEAQLQSGVEENCLPILGIESHDDHDHHDHDGHDH
ncbi:MAG: hypothetical protein KTR13_06985 [Saprospiraceae bacterium]|nr:hypothetical protein [Saprospiraceae bacterium]